LSATETKTVAGEKQQTIDVKGKIVEFMWKLKRDGTSDRTIQNYARLLTQLHRKGADLMNGDSVKDVIAAQEHWSTSTKALVSASYQKFAKENRLSWNMPKYRTCQKLPFIPLESEIDALISSCGRHISTMLQLLKETGMRIGEALRLKWTDLDTERTAILMNNPEKNGKPRMFRLSNKLLSMLNNMPKQSERIFTAKSVSNFERSFSTQRRKTAFKLQNPRLEAIKFHTLRHWKATMEYQKTKDILHVMQLLGHRNIQNTLIYTQLVNFESSDYYSATAQTCEEAKQLVEQGFEYVCTTPENIMLFRKRK